jgi:chromosome segregation protein
MLSDQQLVRQSRQLHAQLDQARGERRQVQWEQDRLREERRSLTDLVHQTDIRIRDLNHQQASLAERIRDEFQLELAELVEQGVSLLGDPHLAAGDESPPVPATQVELADSGGELDHESLPVAEDWTPEDDDRRREIEDRIERLRRKIKALGAINPDSLKDLDEIESQYAERAGQLEDLEQARTALEEIIRRLDAESRKLFMTSFEAIRGHFRALFRKLFGGGEGDIILEDPEDVLECGIDLVARPPGKELRSISLLSGGEKTLTAVALLFAMFKSKPSPYCILDEVDAALDEANVDRYVGMVREFRASTQIIIITHRKRTMSAADRLFGVTMEQPGVSKRLTVRFEDVHEDGQFRTASAA